MAATAGQGSRAKPYPRLDLYLLRVPWPLRPSETSSSGLQPAFGLQPGRATMGAMLQPRALVALVMLMVSGCVTSGAVEDAQMQTLRCWQEYRAEVKHDDPNAESTRDDCEALELRSNQMAARHERQRQAAQSFAASQRQNQTVNCTSNTIGNYTTTSCN
jgi:hypothetical protein